MRRFFEDWAYLHLVALIFMGAEVWADTQPLKVGQVAGSPSLVFEETALALDPVPAHRDEAFPSTTPLSTLIPELPDIVSVLVGYYDSDIATLANSDTILPLGPYFEALGIDPVKVFPPNVLASVTYKGKIWALPHRARTFLLSCDRDTLQRAGVEPRFETWEALFQGAQAVSEAGENRSTEGSFYIGRIPDEALFPFLIWCSGNVPSGPARQSPTILDLYRSFSDKRVFAINDPYGSSPICLESTSTLPSTRDRGLLALPGRIAAGHAPEANLGSLAFLECFAIRKNSEAKLETAKAFLVWLMSVETQIQLVEASRIDRAPAARRLETAHVPLGRLALESAEFKALVVKVPEYELLLESLTKARFAEPEPESPADRNFVMHRRQLAMDAVWTSGMVEVAMRLFAPRSEDEDRTIASETAAVAGQGGSFDAF